MQIVEKLEDIEKQDDQNAVYPLALYDKKFVKFQKQMKYILSTVENNVSNDKKPENEVPTKESDFEGIELETEIGKLHELEFDEKPEPKLSHEGNPVLYDLHRYCTKALEEIDQVGNPDFTGKIKYDRPKKIAIKHFLYGNGLTESGAKIYAHRIGHCLSGLVKYAQYDSDLFGKDNKDLEMAQQKYKSIIQSMNEKSGMEVMYLLHSLVVATKILFERQMEHREPEIITPVVSTTGGVTSEADVESDGSNEA